jgi:hypothetical protein
MFNSLPGPSWGAAATPRPPRRILGGSHLQTRRWGAAGPPTIRLILGAPPLQTHPRRIRTTLIKSITLCYTIVLPGRKSGFRAGFRPECYRENIEIGPFGRPEVQFRCFPCSSPAKWVRNSNPKHPPVSSKVPPGLDEGLN